MFVCEGNLHRMGNLQGTHDQPKPIKNKHIGITDMWLHLSGPMVKLSLQSQDIPSSRGAL